MNKKGFSLVELLIVIAIISTLTALSAAIVSYARDKARTTKALADVAGIYNAITVLANDTTQWPGHQTVDIVATGAAAANNEICGVDAQANTCAVSLSDEESGITQNDSGTPFANWEGPYMHTIINDPWGREYFFDTDYSVDFEGNPCECTNVGCHNVVVVGSYGPDQEGVPTGGSPGAYGCDDIIKVIIAN